MKLLHAPVMNTHRPLPAIEILREHLTYDGEAGKLFWRKGGNGRKAGDIAGSMTKQGYLRFTLLGKQWFVHRVIWALHTGEDPGILVIDHIDGQRDNNRISNLRKMRQVGNTRAGKGRRKPVKISYPCGETIIVRSVKEAAKVVGRKEGKLIKLMKRDDNQLYTGPGYKIPTGIRVSYA